jgi:hypothetical protein
MDDFVLGEHGTIYVLPIGGARQPDDQPVDLQQGCKVSSGENGENAGHFHCGTDVDPNNRRVTVGAAHESRVHHLRPFDVVDEAAFSRQQWRIFNPPDAIAESP